MSGRMRPPSVPPGSSTSSGRCGARVTQERSTPHDPGQSGQLLRGRSGRHPSAAHQGCEGPGAPGGERTSPPTPAASDRPPRAAARYPVQYDLDFRVAQRRALNSRSVELRLVPLAKPLQFVPGQYLLLSDPEGEILPRSYSLTSRPRPDGTLSLLVTEVPAGQGSRWICRRLAVGDRVVVDGPFGDFLPGPRDVPEVLYLAGGVGVAPILALVEEALAYPRNLPLTLLLSVRGEADILAGDRLQAWQREYPRFRFIRTLTRGPGDPPRGRLPALLPGLVHSLAAVSVFAAGPEGFVDACATAALALGADLARIHTEAFVSDPKPWGGALT